MAVKRSFPLRNRASPSTMVRHLHATVARYCQNRRLADEYDHYFSDNPLFQYDQAFVARCLAHAPPPPADAPALLDLGCGTGRHLLPWVRRQWRGVGVDLNPHMIRCALRKFHAAGLPARALDAPDPDAALNRSLALDAPGALFALADFHRLPWRPERRFHAVLLMFSTIGLVRPAARRHSLLVDLRHRLAPGGSLILHVHNALFRTRPPPPAESSLGRRLRDAGRRLAARWRSLVPASGSAAASGDAARPVCPVEGPDADGDYEEGDQLMRSYRGELDLLLHVFTRDEVAGLVESAGYRLREIQPIAPSSDRPYTGPDPEREACGFLLHALAP